MKFFRSQTSSRVATLALGASLLAAACGGSTTITAADSGAASGSDTASASNAASGSTANPLLTGTVGTVAGGQFDLGSLEGQDAVLWFWAPW